MRSRYLSGLGVSLALGFALFCCGKIQIPAVYNAHLEFQSETERVVLVSFDGLRPDAIAPAGALHLKSMQQFGAFAMARSVMPSITLVNHATMISGVGPEIHKITWNSYIPELGTLSVPTIFDLAKKKGLRTAMVAGKEKFKHFDRPGTIDTLIIQEGTPLNVAQDAIEILKQKKPQLLFVHFRHPDSEGHDNGWMGDDQLDAIGESDQALGYILTELKAEGLLESTTVLATADHGGHERGHGTESDVDMTIPWIAIGAEVPVKEPLAAQITQYDTAATVADLLELEIPAGWQGKSVFNR